MNAFAVRNTPPGRDAAAGNDAEGDGRTQASAISRQRLFKRVGLSLGAVSAGGIAARNLASASGASSRPTKDDAVLAFALELERLQSTFYAQALSAGHLTGEVKQFAEIVGHEEHKHLQYLLGILGSRAGTAARYNFGDAFADNQTFLAVAVTLEDTGLAAYNGQATNLSSQALGHTARVISVEARHAAWARSLAGRTPAPVAVDVPISAAQAHAAIRSFIA